MGAIQSEADREKTFLAGIVGALAPVDGVVPGGSRARGTHGAGSDCDIGRAASVAALAGENNRAACAAPSALVADVKAPVAGLCSPRPVF
ncbi:MAG: nucleotidyltransferase domain-containing protein [Planctomycetota bacterium]|jgi:hypothetical protein|nr:nucleotidyltransferase domain-containing protein [Planctomycetota bacterium]